MRWRWSPWDSWFLQIDAFIEHQRPSHKTGYFYEREYRYDAEADVYLCPAEQRITHSTTNRIGYREYKRGRRGRAG